MTSPLRLLHERFHSALTQAFGSEFADVDPMLRRSDRADYQANLAMALAKRLGQKPRDVADRIVAHLGADAVCEKVEVAGPGFINVTLRADVLSSALSELSAGALLPKTEAPETVVLDYSGPNVAKEMHVGHLRSTILGDAIGRTLEALGHKVIRKNHIGDWGTPFGMLIEHLIDVGGDKNADFSVGDLDAFYKAARTKFDADEAFADRSRKRVVLLQGGDAATLKLWRVLCDQSRRYFTRIYEELGVSLKEEHVAGESAYNAALPQVVAELEAKGLAVKSEGAVCVFVPGFSNKEGEPLPLIIQKQDGGYGYATTDLAAIRHRTQELRATRILYVHGAPQAQHFAMVFDTAKRAGWMVPPARAEHVAFGSVLGKDKKMLRTRSGESTKLLDLVSEAIERAQAIIREKNPDLASHDLARAVGLGAIKYADLSSDRIKDYIFDWDRMLAFDGNTAPYIMYAYARIRSMIKKSGEATRGDGIRVSAPQERALALELLGFASVVNDVAHSLEPHRLCGYLFALATAYTGFYENCPVLKAPSDAERQSRLALSELTAKTLATGLHLLGIAAPDAM